MIRKELGFIYIVNGRRFTTMKEAEEYAKQESKIQKADEKEKKHSNKKI